MTLPAMKGTWTAPRIMAATGVLTMIVGGIGFLVVMTLNAFVLDEFDAYGEVPIPGAGQVQLPAGAMTISFPPRSPARRRARSGTRPSHSASTRRRVRRPGPHRGPRRHNELQQRRAHADLDRPGPGAGLYRVRTGGDVDGYINPRLAFGHESDYDYLHYVFAAMFGVGVLDVIMSRCSNGSRAEHRRASRCRISQRRSRPSTRSRRPIRASDWSS